MASGIAFLDRYTKWIVSTFQPYIGRRLLEIGTGHANWKRHVPHLEDYLSVDIDPEVIARAKEKYPSERYLVGDICDDRFVSSLQSGVADTVACFNVIEHVVDDRKAIRHMLQLLSPNGHLLLQVPALPSLFNDMDSLAGHLRRYTRADLISSVGSANPVLFCEYFNPVGGIAWWLNKFVKHENLDSRQINRQVELFDKYGIFFSKVANPCTKKFFGQSLLCVVKKL